MGYCPRVIANTTDRAPTIIQLLMFISIHRWFKNRKHIMFSPSISPLTSAQWILCIYAYTEMAGLMLHGFFNALMLFSNEIHILCLNTSSKFNFLHIFLHLSPPPSTPHYQSTYWMKHNIVTRLHHVFYVDKSAVMWMGKPSLLGDNVKINFYYINTKCTSPVDEIFKRISITELFLMLCSNHIAGKIPVLQNADIEAERAALDRTGLNSSYCYPILLG